MLGRGPAKGGLGSSHPADEVSNVMGGLMNQIVGSFTTKVGRELQTHITQNQPKMLALNKQVMLSVDTNLDNPETRRVTFFTASNNIFYLELAMDKTEFIRIHDGGVQEEVDPDELIAQAKLAAKPAPAAAPASNEHDDLLDSLGI